jgi:hypothetical protein
VITEKESKVELNDGLDIQDFISELLDILDSDRADDWEKWRNIGFIVHSELGNSGFDMFDTFSQQSNKYNKSKVKKFWESIKDNTYKPMTVKSLMACAKKDNIKEYNEIKKEYVKISSKINNTTVTGVYNDLEAAQVVYSLYKHFVCCDSVLYCFDDSTGLWTDKEEILFSIISRFNDSLYLLSKDKDGNIKKSNKGYGNSTVLQRQMLPQLKTLCINNDWVTQTQFSSIGKLLYLNGYLDMKTGTFYYHFDPTIVFIYKIYQFYDLNTLDKKYLEDIKQRYFYNQLG